MRGKKKKKEEETKAKKELRETTYIIKKNNREFGNEDHTLGGPFGSSGGCFYRAWRAARRGSGGSQVWTSGSRWEREKKDLADDLKWDNTICQTICDCLIYIFLVFPCILPIASAGDAGGIVILVTCRVYRPSLRCSPECANRRASRLPRQKKLNRIRHGFSYDHIHPTMALTTIQYRVCTSTSTQ